MRPSFVLKQISKLILLAGCLAGALVLFSFHDFSNTHHFFHLMFGGIAEVPTLNTSFQEYNGQNLYIKECSPAQNPAIITNNFMSATTSGILALKISLNNAFVGWDIITPSAPSCENIILSKALLYDLFHEQSEYVSPVTNANVVNAYSDTDFYGLFRVASNPTATVISGNTIEYSTGLQKIQVEGFTFSSTIRFNVAGRSRTIYETADISGLGQYIAGSAAGRVYTLEPTSYPSAPDLTLFYSQSPLYKTSPPGTLLFSQQSRLADALDDVTNGSKTNDLLHKIFGCCLFVASSLIWLSFGQDTWVALIKAPFYLIIASIALYGGAGAYFFLLVMARAHCEYPEEEPAYWQMILFGVLFFIGWALTVWLIYHYSPRKTKERQDKVDSDALDKQQVEEESGSAVASASEDDPSPQSGKGARHEEKESKDVSEPSTAFPSPDPKQTEDEDKETTKVTLPVPIGREEAFNPLCPVHSPQFANGDATTSWTGKFAENSPAFMNFLCKEPYLGGPGERCPGMQTPANACCCCC